VIVTQNPVAGWQHTSVDLEWKTSQGVTQSLHFPRRVNTERLREDVHRSIATGKCVGIGTPVLLPSTHLVGDDIQARAHEEDKFTVPLRI
jgi:hypothetical protein